MRYLLGSLDELEAAQFERRLQTEPAIGEELVAQSELICQIASSDIAQPGALVAASQSSANTNTSMPWLAAIAASLLVGFVLWSYNSDPPRQISKQATIVDNLQSQADEDLLIAQAWADGPLSLALTSPTNDADEDRSDGESDSALESLDPNEESVLNWMMVAVKAGANREG